MDIEKGAFDQDLIDLAVSSSGFGGTHDPDSSTPPHTRQFVVGAFSMIYEHRGIMDSQSFIPDCGNHSQDTDDVSELTLVEDKSLNGVLKRRRDCFISSDYASKYGLDRQDIDAEVYYEDILEKFGEFVLGRTQQGDQLLVTVSTMIRNDLNSKPVCNRKSTVVDVKTEGQIEIEKQQIEEIIAEEIRTLKVYTSLVRSREELTEFLKGRYLPAEMIDAIVDANRDLYPSIPTTTEDEPLS